MKKTTVFFFRKNYQVMQKKINWRLLLGIIMVFIYLGMAAMLVFTNLFNFKWEILKIIFAILFFLYGVFRGYRLWKSGI